MKVLVADDDTVQRQLLHRMLTKWGYDAEAVEDGDAAWSALERSPGEFDVLLSDWMMPGLDGPALCREVRSNPATRRVHIIMVTSKSGAQSFGDGMMAGADDYLTKPVDFATLRSHMEAAERVIQEEAELEAALMEALEALNGASAVSRELAEAAGADKMRVDRLLSRMVASGEVVLNEERYSLARSRS